ncbi:unnamed protein product, partial [Meganyctiphanes norvegica]
EIADTLHVDFETSEIVNTFRIKPKNPTSTAHTSHPPLLNVELKNFRDKEKFISQESRNKIEALDPGDRFHAIKLFPDKTVLQRKEFNERREEAKKKTRNWKQLEIRPTFL